MQFYVYTLQPPAILSPVHNIEKPPHLHKKTHIKDVQCNIICNGNTVE